MTGRDLIIYILNNHLEDEKIFEDGTFIGFMSEEEIAAKFNVGVSTVKVWYTLGRIPGIKIGDSVFFFKDTKDPRKKELS